MDSRETLAKAWATELRGETIYDESNFFELGGDSLAALRIVNSLANSGLVLSLKDFYNNATLAAQSDLIRTATTAKTSLQDSSSDVFEQMVPLSPLQSAIFFESTVQGPADPFWMVGIYRLPRSIKFERVRSAWRSTVEANPA